MDRIRTGLGKTRLNVFLKFITMVSLGLIICLTVAGLLLIKLQEQALIKEQVKNSQKLTDLVARISAFHIEKFQYSLLDETTIQLQSAARTGNELDVLSVLIYDTTGNKLNPAGTPHNETTIPAEFWHVEEQKAIYQSPTGPKEVGKVVMVFSLESIYQKSTQLRNSFILVMVSTIIVLDVIVGIMLMLLITNPLKILSKSAEQIATGNFDINIDYAANDELGELAQSFNLMSRNLKKSFEQIEQQNVELRRVEVALRESEVRYRSMFEDSPISLWEQDFSQIKTHFDRLRDSGITDLRAHFENHPQAVAHCVDMVRILDVNKATLSLLAARDKKDLLGGLGKISTPESLKVFREQLIALAEGAQHFESEAIQRSLAGDEKLVLLQLTVAPGHENSLGKVLVSLLDITERKQAEAERESLIGELEVKNAELERFVYTVSHDLKSPLITIRGFLGFVEQAAIAGDIEQVKADIARVSSATGKMHQLLDELLELSRIGRLMNPPEEVSLGELAREAVELVTGRLEQQEVEVVIAPELLAPDAPTVYGDRTRLVETLQNLVDNAVKYMGDQPEPRVEIGMRSPERGEGMVFYVRDNGMGIDARYHDKVFGLFQKLDPKSEGSGVGLATVKRIVEVHGGRVWVESQGVGMGSTFCFTLPDERREF